MRGILEVSLRRESNYFIHRRSTVDSKSVYSVGVAIENQTSEKLSLSPGSVISSKKEKKNRDRGATLRSGEGGGAPLVTRYWGGGGGTRHFSLLTLYNFKNIRGHVPSRPPLLRGP